jgi:hypothetical protein
MLSATLQLLRLTTILARAGTNGPGTLWAQQEAELFTGGAAQLSLCRCLRSKLVVEPEQTWPWALTATESEIDNDQGTQSTLKPFKLVLY